MQDFTGVPAVVDLSAMRDAMVKLGGNAEKLILSYRLILLLITQLLLMILALLRLLRKMLSMNMNAMVSVIVFLKWGQQAFQNFRVVPQEQGFVIRLISNI